MPSSSSDGVAPLSTQYFPALTGLRAVAAFLVLLFHLNPLVYADQHNLLIRWTNYFIQQLHVGVPIFFVLSGFLIANRYLSNAVFTTNWLKIYLWNRFIRIYPVYFILTIAAFLIIHYTPEANAGAWHAPDFTYKDKAATIILNLTLLKSFFKTYLTTGIPTAWSLTVEESFYVLAPLLFLGLQRRATYLIIYPIILLFIGTALVYVASLSSHYLYGFMKSMNFMLRFTFFGRSVEFMIGIGLAFYISKFPFKPFLKGTFTTMGVAGIVCCIIALVLIKYHHFPTETWPTSIWSILVQNFTLPFFVASLLYGLLYENTTTQNILNAPLFSVLGKSSYILYLIHIGPFDNILTYYFSSSILIKALIYYAASILLFTWVEEPIRVRLRRVNLISR